MTTFDDSIKEEIRSRIDIATVIGRYVTLKQAGATLKGLCPFHKEKTPSFHVNPTRGFFHCFGCGKGGDVFSFVEQMEGIGFYETLQMLGEECGVEVVKQQQATSAETGTPEAGASVSKTDLFRVHEIANDHFYQLMKKTPAAIEYFKNRGLTGETVRDFKLGFAGDSWTSLIDFCKERGVPEAHLVACGLAVQKETGRCYDRFRNRVIFPLNDLSGKVIGFAGRGMDKETVPKYLNSPETLIYKKKYFLYGLFRARQAIKEAGQVLIVEGYMDYLSLFQAGIRNVVASSGTAFTTEHGQLIGRFARRVILLFDGDSAGQAAIEKAIFTLAPLGLDIFTLSLPGDDDPDSFVRKNGAEPMLVLINKAIPWSDFIINRMIVLHGKTPAGKTAVIEALKPLVISLRDQIIIDDLNNKIAEKLSSTEQEQKLAKKELLKNAGFNRTNSRQQPDVDQYFATSMEGLFIRILLAKPEFVPEARSYVLPETLTNDLSVNIYSLLLEVFDRDGSFDRILDSTPDPEIRRVVSLLMVKDIVEEHIHEELVQKIIFLRKKYLRSRQRECKILMKHEPHRREELLRLLQDYTTQLHELDGGE